MRNCLVFTIDSRHYALPLSAVRRVVRMVDVTPLPEAPPPVAGVVNWGGEIVAVLDMRAVVGAPSREILPCDHLLFAEVQGRAVALAIDSAEEVVTLGDERTVSVENLLPGSAISEEIASVAGELVLIWDLGRFLAKSGIAWEDPGAPAS